MSQLIKNIILFTLLLVLTGCGGADDRKAAYLERGHQLMDEGNFEKAQLEFKNALQIDPKDVDAHYQLGLALEKMGEWRPAMSQFLAAIQLDENHTGAHIHAGQIYLLGNALDEALEEVTAALANEPENPDALVLQGGIKAKKGDLNGAFADGLAALKIDPGHVNSIALLSSLHLAKNESAEALSLVNGGIETHPKDMNLLALKAKILYTQKDAEGAGQILEQIISLDPDEMSHRFQLANFYISQKELDKAEKILRDAALQDKSEDNQAGLLLIEFLGKYRSFEAAEKELLSQIEQRPDDAELQFGLANLYKSKDIDRAISVLKGIAENNKYGAPDGLKAKSHLAVIYMGEQKFDEARQLAEAVLKENPKDVDSLSVRSTLYLLDEDVPKAIADLRSVLKDNPDSVRHLRLLARAHMMNNEPELAREALERASEVDPADVLVRTELAGVLLDLNKPDLAIEQIQRVLAVAPDNEAALETLFKLQSAKKDWKSAKETADKIKEAFPESPVGYHYSGIAQEMDQGFDSSINEYTRALEKSPDSVQPLTQLIRGYMAENKADEALARVDKVLKDNPDNHVALNMKGEILLAQGKMLESREIFRDVIKKKPDFRTPYLRIASTYAMEKEWDKMITVYEAGLQALPEDPVLVTGLASAYEQTGQVQNAIELYEKILFKQPDALLAINNLAMLYVDHHEDPAIIEKAKGLIAKLVDSKSPAFVDTIGWVYYKAGDYDEAIKFLNQAVLSAPDEPILQYHLGMAYLKKGTTTLARQHLGKALDSPKNFRARDTAQAAYDGLGEG